MRPIERNAPKPTSKKLERILYVEDEQNNRDVAELRLASKYDLLLAKDDVEACEMLARHGDSLAAILMDIQLKGSKLDGIQLTHLIRGSLAADAIPDFAKQVPVLNVPVIFVSAFNQKYTEEEIKEAGGDQLIPKPVDFTALMMAITRVHLASVRNFVGE